MTPVRSVEKNLMSEQKRFGERLVEASVITREQLQGALRVQEEQQGFLGQILLELGWITDKQLCQAVSEIFQVNYVWLDPVMITPEVIRLVPDSLAVTCDILPLFEFHNTLYLAMENPEDIGVIQLVEYETGMQVKPVVAPLGQLRTMIGKFYNVSEFNQAMLVPASEEENEGIGQKITREIGLGQRQRLGDLLVEAELLTQAQLDIALERQREQRGYLGQIIIEKGWVTEEQLCKTLAKLLQVENVSIDEAQIDPAVMKLVPESLAMSCNILPLFMDHKILYLAMENPLDIGVIQLLQFNTGMKIEPLVASPSQIRKIIRKYYGTD